MAKTGGPVSPRLPRSNALAPKGHAQPAKAPAQASAPAPAQARGPVHPEDPGPSVDAQQVAQQFVSAFASAGRLAGQLFKGLVANPPPAQIAQVQRFEKPTSTEQAEEPKGEEKAPEAEQGPGEAGKKGSIMSAFDALKRTRLFRFRKVMKLRRGRNLEFVNEIDLADDYNEKERDHHRARNYLGDDKEDTYFDQAKREARVLRHLERQGESLMELARHLNALLGLDREREFKQLLAEQVGPQMDSLAQRIEELSTEERHLFAALIARAAYQVGPRGAESFARLLATLGAVEAAHLEKSTEGPTMRAAQLTRGLRRAVSASYRATLIEAGRDSLEKLAGDTVRLPSKELQLTWVSLLEAAETLEPETLPSMAEALVAGVLAKGGPDAVGPLAEVLGPALRLAPQGGSLVVQLILTLTARGEAKAVGHLTEALRDVLREARADCIPALMALRELRATPAGEADEAPLLHKLAEHVPLLVSLIPTCSRVLEKGQGIPDALSLLTEALLSLATLSAAGETEAGQQLLRRMVLAQERGSETFLSTLPRVALTLAQPKLVRTIWDAGLTPAHFQFGGRGFLERVALQLGRAAVGPITARNRKGEAAAAKTLLRSVVRHNAALFGLTANGAYLAAEALEALRDKPGPVPLKRALHRLGKIRKKHSPGQPPGGLEPFQELVTALAASVPASVPRRGSSAPPPAKPAPEPARAPSLPGKRTPSLSGKRTPSLSGKRTPSLPGKRTPSLPGKRTPSLPGKKAPAAPGRQPPAAPERQPPAALEEQAPAAPERQPPPARANPSGPVRTTPSGPVKATPSGPTKPSPPAARATPSGPTKQQPAREAPPADPLSTLPGTRGDVLGDPLKTLPGGGPDTPK
jgi:hypothetical protein